MKLTKVISRNALSGGRNGRWGITLLIALLAMAAQTAWSQSTYQISNYEQLKAFAQIVNESNASACAQLTADITCNDRTWTPIGNDIYHKYTGTFAGNNHTITGLSNADVTTSPNYAGLFGAIGSSAVVSGITLAEASITGSNSTNSTGGIVGWNDGGTVTDCHVTNTVAVSGSGGRNGGIVGDNGGSVTFCTSGVQMSGSPAYSGGIVGCNSYPTSSTTPPTVTDNFVIGAVIPAVNYNRQAAIAVNYNYQLNNSVYARNYYYGCTVAGTPNATNVGIAAQTAEGAPFTIGDVSSNNGAVRKPICALTLADGINATATPSFIVYGTSLYCLEGATVTLSGQQSDQPPVGSFYEGYAVNGIAIGGNSFNMPAEDAIVTSNIIHCYTLTLTDGITAVATPTITVGSTPYYRPGTTVTLSGRPSESGYIYPYLLNGTAFGGETFTMPASDVTVTVGERVADWDTGSNGSSEETAYQIKTTVDLDLLAQRVNSGTNYAYKYFKLMNDIAYTHTTAWNDATSTENNYTAIGNDEKFFEGEFNGDNHTISGIRIYKGGSNTSSDSYQGLFGYVDMRGTVKNVTLADARITGYENVGGIAGNNRMGTITDCCVATDVALHVVQDGAEKFGGIAGYNSFGTASKCTSGVKISVKSGITDIRFFGGIVGFNNNSNSGGTITDCCAIGVCIPAIGNAGAIVGYYQVQETSDNPLSGSNNTYHSCLVGTNAFNIGVGVYSNITANNTFSGDGGGASLYNTKFYLDDYMDASALIAAYANTANQNTYGVKNLTATLSRTFPAGKKQTICLPFPPVELFNKGTLWEFTAISGTTTKTVTMTMVEKASDLKANTPYIFQATSDESDVKFSNVTILNSNDPKTANADFTFKGTYTQKTWEANDPAVTSGHLYGFMMKDNDGQTEGQFVKARRKTILRPFSCYLEYNGDLDGTSTSSARRRATESLPDVIDIVWKSADGTVTGISTLDTRTGEITDYSDAWYSIDGRRLSGKPTAKGIYIKNGKKSIVK